jgi:hypothetical protein
MYAMQRPHLPRLGLLALAAVLAMIVMLLAASRLGDVGTDSSSGATAAVPRQAVSSPTAAPTDTVWLRNAFASPFKIVSPWSLPAHRRSE